MAVLFDFLSLSDSPLGNCLVFNILKIQVTSKSLPILEKCEYVQCSQNKSMCGNVL